MIHDFRASHEPCSTKSQTLSPPHRQGSPAPAPRILWVTPPCGKKICVYGKKVYLYGPKISTDARVRP